MFRNKTAWFSDSVLSDITRFWVSQGGFIADWRAADYLFSQDASCPDTKRIHMSDGYVKDRATVFHSAYLSTCRLRKSTRSVPLGHYLLPPVSVQKGYVHIDQLKKFSGELHDFLPSHSKYSVSRSHSRRLPYRY